MNFLNEEIIECFDVIPSEKTNSGMEYYFPKSRLKILKFIDRLIVKKYVYLLNKVQYLDYDDIFLFLYEEATAYRLLDFIQYKPIFTDYNDETIGEIQLRSAQLQAKLYRIKKGKISDFEKKSALLEKKKLLKEYYKDIESEDNKHEIMKQLVFYREKNKKKD